MSQFKWSIEYTLERTYPAFMYLTRLIDRIRADETIDGSFAGYTAGKYGEKIHERLYDKRGSFHINRKKRPVVTQKDIDRAVRKAQKIAKEQARKYKKDV